MIDQQLYFISDIIKEAYRKDVHINPLLDIDEDKIEYLLLDTWCKDTEDRITLLKIICKVSEMFPDKIRNITERLLCRLSLIDDSSQEVQILYSLLFECSKYRIH